MSMITSGLAVAVSAAKCFDIVHYGEAAVLKRLGNFEHPTDSHRLYTFPPYIETIGPGVRYGMKLRGIAFSRPVMDRYVRISLLPNTDNELPVQTVRSREKYQVNVGGAFTWQVIHEEDAIYRAVKAVNTNRATDVTPHLQPLVVDRAARQLVGAMAGRTLSQMEDLDAREAEFLERCAERTSPLYNMGISVDSVTLKNPHRTDADVTAEAMVKAAQLSADATRDAAQEMAVAMRDSDNPGRVASLALAELLKRTEPPIPPMVGEQPRPFQVYPGGSF